MNYRYYSYRPSEPSDELPVPHQPPDGKHKRIKLPKYKEKKPRYWLRGILLTLFLVFTLALAGLGYLAWQFFDGTTAMFGGTATGNMLTAVQPTTLKGESRRVNILVTGNSADDPGHPGGELTDSIMILSVDVRNKDAYILSIPRDLWVSAEGYRARKINGFYPLGQAEPFSQSGYAGGGIGLLEKVIEENLDVTVDYHAVLNYTAVREMVDAVGGIDVAINSPDQRGVYDPNILVRPGQPLRLPNGAQRLDGDTALALMRARTAPAANGTVGYGFPRGDFNRTEYQRAVFVALQKKAATSDVYLSPGIMSNLFKAAGKNVRTDIKINEARKLGWALKDIPADTIRSYNLAGDKNEFLRSYATPTGEAALAPAGNVTDFSEIQAYIKSLHR